MNALIIAVFACLAAASASPSGWGLAGPGAILAAPSAGAVVTGPLGGGALWGSPVAAGLWAGRAGIWGGPAVVAAPAIAAPLGAAVATRGGGVVGVSAAGATVAGPPTAPVTITGPSGTVTAKGLWGPTLAGVAGAGW